MMSKAPPEPTDAQVFYSHLSPLQMQKGNEPAVNPFPAVYYTAQRAPDLINGAQQDIHEFWMTLKDLLNGDAGAQVVKSCPHNAGLSHTGHHGRGHLAIVNMPQSDTKEL